MIVSTLIGWGMSAKAARTARTIIFIVAAVLLLGLLAKCALDDAHRDGERANEAKWQAASERLKVKAEKSEQRADVNAAARANEFTARLAEEKEKVDEAVENGADPFGELFPSGVR